MGKIFKALEKSNQTTENAQKGLSDFDSEISSELHDEYLPETDSGEISVAIDPGLVTGLDPQSIEAEQFRTLKNNILFPAKGDPPKSIMITSAAPGAGKSFVAANLAISIAQNIDEHVFLMDCDLRSPSIHSLFGFDEIQGLSEYLSEAKPLSSLLVKTFLDKLTILPAGKIPFNPSELLSSEQMRRLIQEVKLRYNDRYIIIDTPPPYLTSETQAISKQIDGIVIVAHHGKTRKKDILDLIDIYGREKIIGVVYNFAEKKIGYGNSKYGKYGKYGHGKYRAGLKNA
jgi:protein-tyrosine kinase